MSNAPDMTPEKVKENAAKYALAKARATKSVANRAKHLAKMGIRKISFWVLDEDRLAVKKLMLPYGQRAAELELADKHARRAAELEAKEAKALERARAKAQAKVEAEAEVQARVEAAAAELERSRIDECDKAFAGVGEDLPPANWEHLETIPPARPTVEWETATADAPAPEAPPHQVVHSPGFTPRRRVVTQQNDGEKITSTAVITAPIGPPGGVLPDAKFHGRKG